MNKLEKLLTYAFIFGATCFNSINAGECNNYKPHTITQTTKKRTIHDKDNNKKIKVYTTKFYQRNTNNTEAILTKKEFYSPNGLLEMIEEKKEFCDNKTYTRIINKITGIIDIVIEERNGNNYLKKEINITSNKNLSSYKIIGKGIFKLSENTEKQSIEITGKEAEIGKEVKTYNKEKGKRRTIIFDRKFDPKTNRELEKVIKDSSENKIDNVYKIYDKIFKEI